MSVLVFACCLSLSLQDPPSEPPTTEKPLIVTATRSAKDPFDVPFSTDTVTDELMRRRSYRTTPQALRDIPGVMIQETAHGHGSPYIRGFTSFRNLFLIDGVRLNNSVFRSGPNQYWNTVDPFSLDRLEVVKGPSSVLYGSDAIGGTVNAFSRNPYTYADSGISYGGSTWVRFSSAENSIQGRGEISGGHTWEGGARTGALIGSTGKHFGDLEGGEGVGTQPETGYDEVDLDFKVEHTFEDDSRLVFLHQRVRQDGVPRTHRTVFGLDWRGLTVGSDQRRNFDQQRYLTYLQYHQDDTGGVIDGIHANVSWHQQNEQRDRIRGNGNQEFQGFEVGTLGVTLQLESPSPIGRFTYGVEYYRDDVDSFLRRVQNPQPEDTIQGPVADDGTYDLLGVYVQDEIEFSDRFDLTLGGRFNYAAAESNSVRDPVTNTRTSVDENWSALVGSARFRFGIVEDDLNLFGGVSQGFRAPNFSDLTRFDSARSNEFEVPSTDLDPEEYTSFEIGLKAETEDVSLQTAYFYTEIKDQILRFPTGNTNAAGETEVTKANVGDGYVWGVELGTAWNAFDGGTLFGNATYMEGMVSNFQNSMSTLQDNWLTRLMPFTMQLGGRWEEPAEGRYWIETVVVYAAEADRLSFDDQRDTSRIPPGGTPSFFLWHARTGWQIAESTSLNVLLENITDTDYRIHGSGLNGPGRNFIVSFHTVF